MRHSKAVGLATFGAALITLALPAGAEATPATTSYSGSCTFHSVSTVSAAGTSSVTQGSGTCVGSFDGTASATYPVTIKAAESGLYVDKVPVAISGTVVATFPGGETVPMSIEQVGLGFVFQGIKSGLGAGVVTIGSPYDTIHVYTVTPIVS